MAAGLWQNAKPGFNDTRVYSAATKYLDLSCNIQMFFYVNKPVGDLPAN